MGAPCEICRLNESGMFWTACPYRPDRNCRTCEHCCGKDAVYIGGKNLCAKHSRLIIPRMNMLPFFPPELYRGIFSGKGNE